MVWLWWLSGKLSQQGKSPAAPVLSAMHVCSRDRSFSNRLQLTAFNLLLQWWPGTNALTWTVGAGTRCFRDASRAWVNMVLAHGRGDHSGVQQNLFLNKRGWRQSVYTTDFSLPTRKSLHLSLYSELDLTVHSEQTGLIYVFRRISWKLPVLSFNPFFNTFWLQNWLSCADF